MNNNQIYFYLALFTALYLLPNSHSQVPVGRYPDGTVVRFGSADNQLDQEFGTNSTPTPAPTPEPVQAGPASPASTPISGSFVSVAQQQFGGDLMGVLCGSENCVFSPYSIYNVLGMILLGAGGNTEMQLLDVMSLPQGTVNAKELHEAIGNVKEGLLAGAVDEQLVVKLADNIFTSGRIAGSYTKNLKKLYSVDGPVEVNFGQSQQAADTINKYVSDATEGEITDLIQPSMLDADTIAVLINAVYLKADWQLPFDSTLTEKSLFNVAPGVQQPVDMMGLEFQFRYSLEEDLKVIELPYVGGDFVMYIVVPKIGFLEDARADIIGSTDIISVLEQKLQPLNDVELRLPRFSFKDKTDLKELLMSLGLTDVFIDGVSDLSGMVPKGERVPYISAAVHEAKIEVAELGTVAAAATGAVVQVESVGLQRPLFKVDSPFIYFLAHKPTNTVLFMGQVIDPTIEE